jgi:thioredoxin-dependent peroxiredoxin
MQKYLNWILVALLLLVLSCNKSGSSGNSQKSSAGTAEVKVGDAAPDFTLPGYPSQEFTLSQHLNQAVVVLYFYPKDNTPDCNTQACAFRDAAAEFSRYGALIVGISRDDVASHGLFADELDLPFPLLYDQNGSVREKFGNPDGSKPLVSRITYVIDGKGKVVEIISSKEAGDLNKHVLSALEAVKKLSKEMPTSA